MEKVALTGGNGFLGWHLRAALLEDKVPTTSLSLGANFSPEVAASQINDAELVVHLAGVNRGSEEEVAEGNILFAEQLSEALMRCESPPKKIVYANSVQCLSNPDSVYGKSKLEASKILAKRSGQRKVEFQNVFLPNIFGEHGRPNYNSVTATFCDQLANGAQSIVETDTLLTLAHAQDVADLVIGKNSIEKFEKQTTEISVSELLNRIRVISDTYNTGVIPQIEDSFSRNLFNTYRSHLPFGKRILHLEPHADERGEFLEIIRSRGGSGQTSFSTTVPNITRGNHFHRRKIERFVVISGEATIKLRRVFSDDTLTFNVSGKNPVAIDMPTMWAHNITNTGTDTLLTAFWTDQLYTDEYPDTIPESV